MTVKDRKWSTILLLVLVLALYILGIFITLRNSNKLDRWQNPKRHEQRD